MNNNEAKEVSALTADEGNGDNQIMQARETCTEFPDEGLNAVVRFLARRAAERDYAAFISSHPQAGFRIDIEGA